MSETPTILEAAILKTLVYGQVFQYPMTPAEIHHYLIEYACTLTDVETTLESSTWLRDRVIRVNGYIALAEADAVQRHAREQISAQLWEPAIRYGQWIAYLPFVRMVALTGALAMRNAATVDDDFDYLIVTAPRRVWLVRGLVVLGVRLGRLWGVELCPNYVVSSRELLQKRQDLYVAHELAQMFPLSGYELYQTMRDLNEWSDTFLPNATMTFYDRPQHQPHRMRHRFQRIGEWVLGGRLGDWVNTWERQRKTQKFAQEDEQATNSAAVIDAEQVKGHFNDYGHRVLQRYEETLYTYGFQQFQNIG